MSKAKQFRFEEEARTNLRDGIEQLAEVVSMTLGPRGRNVGLQASYGSPQITSDGHSIALGIELKDPFLNMGAEMAKQVASKIKEKSGDGTTTGIVLLRALVQAGVKNIASGANPTAIKRGMDKALEAVLKEIDQMATLVKSNADTRNIATVSGNEEIGEKIAECFAKAGKSGVVTIEEGKGTETVIEMVEGMQFERGYVSSHMCTNAEKLLVEMTNPLILITDKKVNSAQEILPILQHIATTGTELLIVADDIDGDALSTLVMNKLRGTLKVAAVKAPGFGDRRKALLEDLAILTGGQLITEEKGMTLKEATVDQLGQAQQVVIGKEKTTIVGGKGSSKEIKARVAQLETESKKAGSDYDREKLEERKAKLQGGVAVIKVGAPTESEMKKKKQMYEDSLSSTRAALEEGIVPGGGVALLRASRAIKMDDVGAKILLRACEAPFKQIVFNTGYDSSLLLEEVLKGGKNIGFNAVTEKVEDLLKAGVIDPAKVVKNSLIYAVSVAGMVLLSEALMANEED